MKSTPEVRRSLPYVSEVGAVLLGLLAVVAVVLQFGPPGSAMVAGGSAAIVGAIALKDTPQGRLRLTLGASLATGGAAGVLALVFLYYLIPFGAWGLVEWTNRLELGKRRLAWWIMGGLMVLSLIVAAWNLLPYSNTAERTEQRTAGEWIAENTPKDARVMTRSFHVQGYSHRDVVAMPSAEYRAMLEFARRMGVSYIVADENTIRRRRPEVYDILMRETGAPAGLKLVHQFTERGVRWKRDVSFDADEWQHHRSVLCGG